jgi:hypothetical protein
VVVESGVVVVVVVMRDRRVGGCTRQLSGHVGSGAVAAIDTWRRQQWGHRRAVQGRQGRRNPLHRRAVRGRQGRRNPLHRRAVRGWRLGHDNGHDNGHRLPRDRPDCERHVAVCAPASGPVPDQCTPPRVFKMVAQVGSLSQVILVTGEDIEHVQAVGVEGGVVPAARGAPPSAPCMARPSDCHHIPQCFVNQTCMASHCGSWQRQRTGEAEGTMGWVGMARSVQ